MSFSEPIVGAALAALAWVGLKAFRDLKGLSKKINRQNALLVKWADTDEKRNQIADLIAGK